jgi:addiction module HigA family antidote
MVDYTAKRDRNRCPTHTGEVLREDVLPALGMSVTDVATALNVTRQTLHRVPAGTTAVTPEMALRLGKFCGNGPGLWLRMQAAYDLWHAERRLSGELAAIKTAKVAYP